MTALMKRVLVTGANKGIGLAIATAILAEHDDAHVLLGSRSPERGREAVQGLTAVHPTWLDRVEVVQLDVSSDDSVDRTARDIGDRFGRTPAPLYGLVNNSGIGRGGLKAVLDVNTLGVRRVCEAFLPLLEPSGGRIVNITSAAGPSFVSKCSAERQRFFLDRQVAWSNLEALMKECLALEGDAGAFAERGLGDGDPYGLSKACANSYTMLLAREHRNLRVNACTPGFIETDMTRDYASRQGKTPSEMGMKPPAAGARAAMFLLFGEPDGNGRYYGSDGQRSPLDRYRSPSDPPYVGE
jgi:NAD(P)-dependent dehydrogenase (short-subunit alcohol dehydrogenase family)